MDDYMSGACPRSGQSSDYSSGYRYAESVREEQERNEENQREMERQMMAQQEEKAYYENLYWEAVAELINGFLMLVDAP
jgi:hypothetical protein